MTVSNHQRLVLESETEITILKKNKRLNLLIKL